MSAPPPPPVVHHCHATGCVSIATHLCVGCRSVRYCSVECQKKDWSSNHKNNCKPKTSTTTNSYAQPEKNYVRDSLLQHAINVLTRNRANNCAIPRTYVNDAIQALLSDGELTGRFPHFNATQFKKLCNDWELVHDSYIGSRTASSLRVAYLAGDDPMNDFRALVKLGILPANIWTFELDDLPNIYQPGNPKSSILNSALLNIAKSEFPMLKIVRGDFMLFLKDHPMKFDIIYIDHTLALPSMKGETMKLLVTLFKNNCLEPLSVLITNFSFEPATYQDGKINEKAIELRNTYSEFMAAYMHSRECSFVLHTKASIRKEQDRDSGFDELNEIDLDDFAKLIARNPEYYYSQFLTRVLIDLAGLIIPWQRLSSSPILAKQFLNSSLCPPFNPIHDVEVIGLTEQQTQNLRKMKQVIEKNKSDLTDALTDHISPEPTFYFGRIADNLKEFSTPFADDDENVIEEEKDDNHKKKSKKDKKKNNNSVTNQGKTEEKIKEDDTTSSSIIQSTSALQQAPSSPPTYSSSAASDLHSSACTVTASPSDDIVDPRSLRRPLVRINNSTRPSHSSAQLQKLIDSFIEPLNLSATAPSSPRLPAIQLLQRAFRLVDICLNWEHYHLSVHALDPRLLHPVLGNLNWPKFNFDLLSDPYENSDFPQLCDVPTPNIITSGVFGQLSYPLHVIPSVSKRWRYTAKHRPMFVDALVFDSSRYVYDMFPSALQIPNGMIDIHYQIICRILADGLRRRIREINEHTFRWCSVVSDFTKSFPPSSKAADNFHHRIDVDVQIKLLLPMAKECKTILNRYRSHSESIWTTIKSWINLLDQLETTVVLPPAGFMSSKQIKFYYSMAHSICKHLAIEYINQGFYYSAKHCIKYSLSRFSLSPKHRQKMHQLLDLVPFWLQ